MFPEHIALIIDGNRRWASANNKTLQFAYNAGMKAVFDIVWGLRDSGLKNLTIFAFSKDNLKRSELEKEYIFKQIDMFLELVKKLKVNVRFFGEIKKEDIISDNALMNVNIALGYSSKSDILNAVKKSGGDINKFEENLSTHFLTPPDMIIRSGKHHRLSDFMLYESGYSELYFLDKLWPDVKMSDINECIKNFEKVNRNYGV